MPVNAQTADGCGHSFMILPGGNCLNLGYTSILGASRRNVSQANAQYQELFDANVTLEVIYDQYPLLDNETEEEREERIDNLVATKQLRDRTAVLGQSIEEQLYPLHVQSMYIVGEAFR
ncbi:hypothetical protein H6F75_27190 [Nodosilinea sp. FACHB-131]|uniref:hypothetical protein n=1 Tax=Cyanophyceae TaxID=3028117 RepID=UPI001686D5D4|nr:hypothetical protein [Nodosilinea sp. FACHB-131]MBD1877173.1 hypothetical protein [Nodosilinea sp. FACHB-131]